MREFEYKIDESLKNGLTSFDVTPINTPLLEECLGFRVGNAGLELYEALRHIIPGIYIIDYSWPFPQVVTGERYNFLIMRDSLVNMEDKVYLLSDDSQTLTHIFSIDQLTFGLGTLMEVADFGLYAFMTNGVVMIYWDTTINDWHEVVASATIPMMRTVCNFKGQAVGGNIVNAWHDCNETFYVWSRIGEIDFTPTLRNEEGYKRCPFGGTVYHTRRLGDNVIGYSSKGITMMVPVKEPAATFGFVEMSDVGLINQGAMNGNLGRQIYVGEDYILREITRDGIKELGFKHYMEQLTGEDIIVQYDPSKKDFYIGNSSKTYLLSPKGLTEIPQHPSAIWRRDRETYILPETVDDYKPLIVSETFNMEYGGQKTIHSVESDILLADNLEAAIDYYFSPTNYGTSNFKPLNDQGVCAITVGGNYFRIHLRFDPTYNNPRISFIKARYKMNDMRGIRGVYAPPPRGQI